MALLSVIIHNFPLLLLFVLVRFLAHFDLTKKLGIPLLDFIESFLLLPSLDMILVNSWRSWLLKLDLIYDQVHEGGLGIPVT